MFHKYSTKYQYYKYLQPVLCKTAITEICATGSCQSAHSTYPPPGYNIITWLNYISLFFPGQSFQVVTHACGKSYQAGKHQRMPIIIAQENYKRSNPQHNWNILAYNTCMMQIAQSFPADHQQQYKQNCSHRINRHRSSHANRVQKNSQNKHKCYYRQVIDIQAPCAPH